MSHDLTPVQLRERGFEVLVESLGWVNAVRFIQQYETSKSDYVLERDQIFSSASVAELVQGMKEIIVEKAGKPKN